MADNMSKEPPNAGAARAPERVAQLLSNLNRASSATAAGGALAPDRERLRYIWVLVHISKFVREIGATADQSRYISDLALMLNDLDDGVLHPMLMPRKFGRGRRGNDSITWRARGRVATG